MKYKPDWDAAKTRSEAWWNHAVVDRCCIAVHAPKKNVPLPPVPDLQNGPWLHGLENLKETDHAAIRNWWTDADQNFDRAMLWFENTYFGGEALPITYVNWGAMAMAALFGSPPEFFLTSVWYPAVIKDWTEWQWDFDKDTSETWRTIVQIVERFIAGAQGNYFVGSPELGNGADVLSLMRGMDKLALDLVMHPEQVRQGVEFISNVWVDLMEDVHQMTARVNEGGNTVAWMGLWAPGRTDQIACDFSSVISPQMFTEFFIPEILKMGDWCEYGVYHLDGPTCMRNMLDILLEIDQIKTIQFTPGAGMPPTYSEEYIPKYQKILASGKNLYLLTAPDEVEKILTYLPPEGLFMRTYVNSQEEAEALLRIVGKWSAGRKPGG